MPYVTPGSIVLVGLAFVSALLAVSALVPHVRRFAERVGAVQRGGGRHGYGARQHRGDVPNLGGVAILGGFLVALLVGTLAAPERIADMQVELLAIVLGGVLMTLVGFVDDVWEVPVAMRLASQAVAAGILVVNGVKIDFITNYFAQLPGAGPWGDGNFVFFGETMAVLVTLVWVVGFTNAFNFMDGMDGLSSGVAVIGSLSLLAVAMQVSDRGATVLLLAALAGAAIGFLRHNVKPAAIFMGDAGAYLLGYTLAAASVLGALKVTAAVTVAAPLLILGLPVLNITHVTLRRMRRGRNPAVAGNDHLHDVLRRRSGSERATVVVLWTATLLLGTLGMILARTPPALLTLTICGAVVLIGGATLLRWLEVRGRARSAS